MPAAETARVDGAVAAAERVAVAAWAVVSVAVGEAAPSGAWPEVVVEWVAEAVEECLADRCSSMSVRTAATRTTVRSRARSFAPNASRTATGTAVSSARTSKGTGSSLNNLNKGGVYPSNLATTLPFTFSRAYISFTRFLFSEKIYL